MTHSHISFQMSRNFTISCSYSSFSHAILFHRTYGYTPVLDNRVFFIWWDIICRLKMQKQFITDTQEEQYPVIQQQISFSLSNFFFTSAPTMVRGISGRHCIHTILKQNEQPNETAKRKIQIQDDYQPNTYQFHDIIYRHRIVNGTRVELK